jgi:hypothetical protein
VSNHLTGKTSLITGTRPVAFNEAPYVTGTGFVVDGGRSAVLPSAC